jgi:3-oxoacyl-ACP reductase-like protein
MKKYAPLATLVAVVLLGAVLLVVNMLGTPQKPQNTAAPAAVAESAPAAPPAAASPAAAAPPAAAVPAAAAPAVAEKAYTGRSAGNEVTVTIAVKDGKGVAYVCDGKKVEAWMEGALDGDKLTLQGKSGSLSATVDAKASLGEITVDGAEWPFSAKGVAAPAGLYQDRAAIKTLGVRAVTQR